MTDFLIGFPDIQARAVQVKSTVTWDEDFSVHNLRRGERYLRAKLATSATGVKKVNFDSGAGVTKQAQYLIIARADLLKAANVSQITLHGNASAYGSNAIHDNASFGSATLYGPRSHDYVATFATSSAYRHWWMEYNVSATSVIPHSKTYFGMWFDMGVELTDYDYEQIPLRESAFISSNGTKFLEQLDEPIWKFDLVWENVTDAKLVSFQSDILNNRDRDRFFLYTSSFHDPLNGFRLVHCGLSDFAKEKVKLDKNTIRCTFQEVLG